MTKKVLITGVYGLIGNAIYQRLMREPEAYEVHGLARRRHASDRISEEAKIEVPEDKFHLVHLEDYDGLLAAFQGIDVVVHMAADPSGRSGFASILNSNIIGAYHVFEAARQAGVSRVVFASTIQVVFGYRDTEPYKSLFEAQYDEVDPAEIPKLTHTDPTRPLNLYASSKIWGEALAHMYAYRHDLSCLCLRIGWVVAEDRPPSPAGRNQWCSQRDIAQLAQACVDAPESVRFDVFYGFSDNAYGWVDLDHAREVVGYAPQDSAEDF